jgi:multiple sugar transport system ATP-binding protein
MGSPAMNLLPAKVQGGQIVVAGHSLPAPSGLAEGQDLTFGIRPEHVRLGAGVEGRVTLVEPTGSETVVTVDLAGHPVTALLRERQTLRPGEPVAVSLATGDHHLFDAATGRRI